MSTIRHCREAKGEATPSLHKLGVAVGDPFPGLPGAPRSVTSCGGVGGMHGRRNSLAVTDSLRQRPCGDRASRELGFRQPAEGRGNFRRLHLEVHPSPRKRTPLRMRFGRGNLDFSSPLLSFLFLPFLGFVVLLLPLFFLFLLSTLLRVSSRTFLFFV